MGDRSRLDTLSATQAYSASYLQRIGNKYRPGSGGSDHKPRGGGGGGVTVGLASCITDSLDTQWFAEAQLPVGVCYYPHIPIGKMLIYRLQFVFVCVCVFVCTVADFSAEINASGVKVCTESDILGNFAPRSPKSAGESASVHIEL